MHIAIFTDTYAPQVNGVVTSTRILREELRRRGHRVTVFTVTVPNAAPEPGVVRLPSVMFPALPEHRIGLIPLKRIMHRIRGLGIDVIHTQTEFSVGLFGRYVARRLGIPVVHTYHTMYEEYTHYITRGVFDHTFARLARRASSWFCRGCAGVIAPTEKTRTALGGYGLQRPVSVVPTGIRLDHFAPENQAPGSASALREELGIPETAPVVIYIGRLAREKSIDVVVRAMPDVLAKHPDARLVIVGGGPERGGLEALARNLDADHAVTFTGPVPFADIGTFYNAADIFVSASTSETQGLTYIEAMAANIAVVAKRDASLDGLLNDGVNGRHFVADPDLAPILTELLDDAPVRRRLADAGRLAVKNITAEAFAANVEAVYCAHTSKERTAS